MYPSHTNLLHCPYLPLACIGNISNQRLLSIELANFASTVFTKIPWKSFCFHENRQEQIAPMQISTWKWMHFTANHSCHHYNLMISSILFQFITCLLSLQFMVFGVLLCLDVYLFIFTFLPIRAVLAICTFIVRIFKCKTRWLLFLLFLNTRSLNTKLWSSHIASKFIAMFSLNFFAFCLGWNFWSLCKKLTSWKVCILNLIVPAVLHFTMFIRAH